MSFLSFSVLRTILKSVEHPLMFTTASLYIERVAALGFLLLGENIDKLKILY